MSQQVVIVVEVVDSVLLVAAILVVGVFEVKSPLAFQVVETIWACQ